MKPNIKEAISKLACASVSKRGFMQNLSYENEFDLFENEPVGGTHFDMNDFAWRLVLTHAETRGNSESNLSNWIKRFYRSIWEHVFWVRSIGLQGRKWIKGTPSRYFWPSTKLPWNWRKPENNALQRWKNTQEIIINHKGTRMVKDGEDWHGLQTTKLKNLG